MRDYEELEVEDTNNVFDPLPVEVAINPFNNLEDDIKIGNKYANRLVIVAWTTLTWMVFSDYYFHQEIYKVEGLDHEVEVTVFNEINRK